MERVGSEKRGSKVGAGYEDGETGWSIEVQGGNRDY